MKKILLYMLIGVLPVVFSCDDDPEVFPVVQTLDITPTSASGFLVKGNIESSGDALVLEYGFVYSTTLSKPDLFQGTKDVAGSGDFTGLYERNIFIESSGAVGGYSVYIRAYLTNQKGTVYGEVKTFTIPTLTTSAVTPLLAKTGDAVTISGQNFSTTPEENVVLFGNKKATITSATTSQLVVTVPPGIISGVFADAYAVYVTTGGQTVKATENFRVLPTVTDFSPKSGTFGTSITITGSDFIPFGTSIKIGGKEASATAITETSVSFTVPAEVATEKSKIQLLSGTDVIQVPGEFTIVPPQITSITPLVGIGGTRVTITGSNFNTGTFNFTNNVIRFGTTQADAFGASTTEIIAFVPKGLAIGNYPISIFTGIHTVTFSTPFNLTSPVITSFTPTSGIAGTYVTITGTNFGEYDNLNSILFGSTQVDLYSWSDTSIIVFIPIGTPSGSVKITVNASGQSVTSATNYTIL